MSKWAGMIGFAEDVETALSVYEHTITERKYYGDLVKNNRRLTTGDTVNGTISVANQLSIVADPFAQNHFYAMRYVTLYGAKWEVTNVDVEFPRLILTLGGLYHG